MARRRNDDAESVNMDTMMDNMTDVVGTLLMIMIVVQIQVADRAGQIEESLSKVTAQDVEAAKKQLEATKIIAQKAGSNQDQLTADAKSKEEDLRKFETTLEQKGIKIRDIETLQKDLAESRSAESEEKRQLTGLLGERDNLRAALDKTPAPKAPPPIDVRVPIPRPFPVGAFEYRVLCLSNKVYILSPELWRLNVWKELEKAKYELLHSKQNADPKALPVFDHLKTVNWLNERKFSDEFVELRFPLNTNSMTDRVTMQIFPRADAGETPEQVDDVESNFRKTLVKLRANPKNVCWFWVHPTGVAAYHASREQCGRYGIPAGWEFYNATSYAEVLPQFVVSRFKEPPPPPPPPPPGTKPPPPPKPAGPTTINIAAPKKTLD